MKKEGGRCNSEEPGGYRENLSKGGRILKEDLRLTLTMRSAPG